MKKEKQKPIMSEIHTYLLEDELRKKARFVKKTENGGNHIYVFSGKDCPNLMLQVGILREISFRNSGGGTGLPFDIDRFDEFAHPDFPGTFADAGFKQLIVWDSDAHEIIGGYRYAKMSDFINDSCTAIDSPTIELFDCSSNFIRMYAPFTIELGRSFVQPKYQLRGDAVISERIICKAMYALNNLFDGLGTLTVDYKEDNIQYFFGKVTMYKTYNRQARNMILYYMNKHFPDTHRLVMPKSNLIPLGLNKEITLLDLIFVGNTEREDKQILKKSLRDIKEGIPPLFKKYTEMSPTLKVFGTAINHHCGEVEETALMIKISDIVEEYQKNYILKYLRKKFNKIF